MAVSKRTRYEVLKRDNYTCRYCGASQETSPLTIDHVTPASLGGTDNPDNLVAACRDCNYGKASSNPNAELVANVSDDAIRWATAIKAASAAMLAEVTKSTGYEDELFQIWDAHVPSYGYAPALGQDWTLSLHRWLAAGLPFEVIKQAAYYALDQQKVPSGAKFRYFAKICWNKVTELQETARASLAARTPVLMHADEILEHLVDGRDLSSVRWVA